MVDVDLPGRDTGGAVDAHFLGCTLLLIGGRIGCWCRLKPTFAGEELFALVD